MAKLQKNEWNAKQFRDIYVLFAFKVIEDTYHGTPTHNEYNSLNNGHNAY